MTLYGIKRPDGTVWFASHTEGMSREDACAWFLRATSEGLDTNIDWAVKDPIGVLSRRGYHIVLLKIEEAEP